MSSGFGMGPIPGRDAAQPKLDAPPPPPAAARGARLRLLNGPQSGRTIELPLIDVVIGRSDPPDVNVELDLTDCELGTTPVISRRHAKLCWVEGSLMLQDLGSTNGTRVNGEVLRGAQPRSVSDMLELKSGDRLILANLEFELEIDE